MKRRQLTSGGIIILLCALLSFSTRAQERNLKKDNNPRGATPDSLKNHNAGSTKSDEDIQKMPMNNVDNINQTTLTPERNSSLPSKSAKTTTPGRLNRSKPDSTYHLNPPQRQRQDLSTSGNSSQKLIRNKNRYLVPDSTLRK